MNSRALTLIASAVVLVAAATGAWLMTNSLRSSGGLVSGISACWQHAEGSKQIDCLSDRFLEGATDATNGLKGSERDERLLAFVRATELAAADDERLAGVCHPAMHQLGRREGSRYARAGRAPAFPTASSQLCTAGYVHGVAEGYLTGTPDAEVAAVFPALCHVTKAREGCAHGVGHALLRAQDTSNPAVAARAATSRCTELPEEFPTNCMNGVYMELAMRRQPSTIPPSDYVAACRAVPLEDGLSCWGYMSLNLTTNDVALEQVPTWCAKADLPGQYPCVEEYGRDLGAKRVAECRSVDGEDTLKERCVDGAIGLQVGSGHVTPAAARSACDTIDARSLRAHCRHAVERYSRGRERIEADG